MELSHRNGQTSLLWQGRNKPTFWLCGFAWNRTRSNLTRSREERSGFHKGTLSPHNHGFN